MTESTIHSAAMTRPALRSPEASADRALEELGRRDVNQIPVLEECRLHGIVRHRDLARWLPFHRQGSHA